MPIHRSTYSDSSVIPSRRMYMPLLRSSDTSSAVKPCRCRASRSTLCCKSSIEVTEHYYMISAMSNYISRVRQIVATNMPRRVIYQSLMPFCVVIYPDTNNLPFWEQFSNIIIDTTAMIHVVVKIYKGTQETFCGEITAKGYVESHVKFHNGGNSLFSKYRVCRAAPAFVNYRQ